MPNILLNSSLKNHERFALFTIKVGYGYFRRQYGYFIQLANYHRKPIAMKKHLFLNLKLRLIYFYIL